MRIATLVCPSFTVLAGVLLKANGDRHTLLSPVQPAYWLCWLALTLQRRRCHQTQQFAGRIADALWPVMHVLPPLPASSVITRQKGKTRMTRVCSSLPPSPTSTATGSNGSKGSPQAQVSTAAVGCRVTAATETQIIHHLGRTGASVRSSPATIRGGSID
jgi:hypothetical protein